MIVKLNDYKVTGFNEDGNKLIAYEIIKHLEEMPANALYSIAPKEYVLRGFKYYKEGRLLGLEWSQDRHVLEAKVRGSKLYSVAFLLEKKRLNYRCDCPAWSPSGHCKHIICALATIKNLLNPVHFNVGKQNADFRDFLKTSLFSIPEKSSEKKEISPHSIEIEKRYGGHLNISLQKGDMPVYPFTSNSSIPKELMQLLRDVNDNYWDSDKRFLKYLHQNGKTYPIFLKIRDKRFPVEWVPANSFSSLTSLNAEKSTVTLKRLCISDNIVCHNPYLLSDNIVADLENKTLGIIEDRTGWRPWKLFLKSMEEDDIDLSDNEIYAQTGRGGNDLLEPLQIPLTRFHDYQFSIPDEYKTDIQFMVDNAVATQVSAEHSYSMTIEHDEMDQRKMILSIWCDVEGYRGTTSKCFFNFLKYFGNDQYLSGSLRTKKRRLILIKTFLMLLSAQQKGKIKDIIADALSTEEFYKRKPKSMARQCLTDVVASLNIESSRLLFYNGKWYLVKNDRAQESLLYTIPYEIFGADIFNGIISHNEMTVSAEDMYKHLPELHLKLTEHNIPLFFKGKPIQILNWDFSFDCTRDSGIDWFEIRPEIRCSGKLVDDDSWHMALQKDGVVEGEDFIQILDPNSSVILRTIASMLNGHSGSKDKIREIVNVPRLQILDWIHLRNKGVTVRLSKEDEDLIERLTKFEKIEKRPIPDNLKANLRHYQKDAYYWLSFLYEHRLGACLADDMGLGKTLEAMTLLAGIKEGKVKPAIPVKGTHLIVLPPSLLFNWENELQRFYPDLKTHLYTGLERTTEFKDSDVVLTTYGLMRRDIEKFKTIQFNVIIFDEAQAIKNIYADTTGAVRQLKAYFKLTMTGTPVENHLGEYYSILDLSLPGLLGEYDNFKSYIKLDTSPSLDLILRRTRPFVLRRTKEKILKELPAKTESDIYLELTDKQKILYKKTVAMIKSTIDEAYHTKTMAQAQIIALTAILRLRQLCVSPKLIDPTIDEPSPKIEFLIGKLKELMDEKHSALVFSQFTSFLDIIEKDLKQNNLPYCRLDGSTAVVKRKKIVEGFQDGENASIFLLSLKAGGQGLNLTKASYVFHLDPWWNPAVENQASDRAHRIGQKNKVSVMRILMRHTIEEKMMELKKKKLELYNAVMEDTVGKKKGLSISKADFDYLLA